MLKIFLYGTGMTLMVHQLPPTQHGLPLELYAFCKDKNGITDESVQADIFNHLLAVASEFDLKFYQYPTGADVQKLSYQTGTPVD